MRTLYQPPPGFFTMFLLFLSAVPCIPCPFILYLIPFSFIFRFYTHFLDLFFKLFFPLLSPYCLLLCLYHLFFLCIFYFFCFFPFLLCFSLLHSSVTFLVYFFTNTVPFSPFCLCLPFINHSFPLFSLSNCLGPQSFLFSFCSLLDE